MESWYLSPVFSGGLGRKQNKSECWRYWFTHPWFSPFQSHFHACDHFDKVVQRIYIVVFYLWTIGFLFLTPTISHMSFLTPSSSPELVNQDCKFSKCRHLLHFQNTFQYVGCVGRRWWKIRCAVTGPWHPVAIIPSFHYDWALQHHAWLLANAWSQLSASASSLPLSYLHCSIARHGVSNLSCTCTANAVQKEDQYQNTRAAFSVSYLAVKKLKIIKKVLKSMMKEVEVQEWGSLIPQMTLLSQTQS